MAKVIIKKDFAEDIIKRVDGKTETLLDLITTLGVKLSDAKNVYKSDNSTGASFDDMSETINKIISSYSTLNKKFQQALRDNIEEYSKADKQISSNVNAVSSLPLTAGSGIGASILTSHAANSAANANARHFLDERQLSKDSFEKDGEYSFEYRNDGSVKVKRDGEPLVFTTKDNADFIVENDDRSNPDYAYKMGVGLVDNKDSNYQKRLKENNSNFYANSDAESIGAYESGIRDASINTKVANETIKNARGTGETNVGNTKETRVADARNTRSAK